MNPSNQVVSVGVAIWLGIFAVMTGVFGFIKTGISIFEK